MTPTVSYNSTLNCHLIAFLVFAVLSLIPTAQASTTSEQPPAAVDQETLLRYLLTPFDNVSISIYKQPDLSSSQRISDIGTVALPLVGEIKIAGLTTSAAQQAIGNAYIDSEYLVKPVVTVHIDSFTEQTVTILGEVSSPGQVILPIGAHRMEIQRVIALAGDFADIAKKNSVRIERRISGKSRPDVFVVDVQTIMESTNNKKTTASFYVQPGDIIFVPRRAF